MEWKLVFEKKLDPVMAEPIRFAAPDEATALRHATEAVPPLLGPWHLERDRPVARTLSRRGASK